MTQRRATTAIFLTIVMLISGITWLSTLYVKAADGNLAPKLESITGEGYPEEYSGIIFDYGTLITVEYSVDRFAGINGVILVGYGSNLTTDIDSAISLNYSHSLKAKSYYTGVFNLTENTRFKAYAWIGDKDNGTYEELSNFNHLEAWHYLYVSSKPSPPKLYATDKLELTGTKNVYYTVPNTTVTIYYKIPNGSSQDNITLAVSVYRDLLYNASVSDFTPSQVQFIPMTYYLNETGTGDPIFNVSLTFNQRTLYFTANTSEGWDSWSEDDGHTLGKNLNIYQITNGFYFTSEPVSPENYTDIDDVVLRIKAYNSTDSETYGIRYFVEASDKNRTKIVDVTEKNATLVSTYNETSDEGFNTTVREYECNIGSYNVGNIVFYEAYNIYYGEYYNETTGDYHLLTIYDSLPQLTLLPTNNSYFNTNNVTFTYTIELAKGTVTGVLMDFGDGIVANLTGQSDNTTTHSYPVDVSTTYTITLYVNSSIGTNNSLTQQIILDFVSPTLSVSYPPSNNITTKDGYVELHFNYTDNNGIKRVWIYWDDGTVENATGNTFANHYYLESGEYNVIIEVEDLAGNVINQTVIINVAFPSETPTQVTPMSPFWFLLGLVTIATYVTIRKRE
ncbi:MAG: PKD domain-containing protein [Candidatus Heimdallarchaeaceae archaeon]